MERGIHILLSATPDNGSAPIRLDRHARHILTPQRGAQIPKHLHGIPILPLLGDIVQRKLLIVRQGQHLGGGQERGMVDGGVVVEGLDGQVVLVRDARVVDVDEPVGRAAQQDGRVGGVEGQLGDVVAVEVLVVRFGGGGQGAQVPEVEGCRVVLELGSEGDGFGGGAAGEGEDGGVGGYEWELSFLVCV